MVRAVAHRVALRNRITDHQEDLAQSAILETCASGGRSGVPVAEESIERRVARLAAKEVNRRRTESSWRAGQAKALHDQAARNPREIQRAPINLPPVSRPKRTGIPVLCPRIVRLADGTGHEAVMAHCVLAAAAVLARRPKILQPRQFKAFTVAYVYELSISEVIATLGATSRGATDTLWRVSRRIEAVLVTEIESRLEPGATALLRRLGAGRGIRNAEALSAGHVSACAHVAEILRVFSAATHGKSAPK